MSLVEAVLDRSEGQLQVKGRKTEHFRHDSRTASDAQAVAIGLRSTADCAERIEPCRVDECQPLEVKQDPVGLARVRVVDARSRRERSKRSRSPAMRMT